MTDLRKNVTESTTVHAVVGVTDLAVEKMREAQQRATRVRSGLEQRASRLRTEIDLRELPETIQQRTRDVRARAQQLPGKALEAAGRAEETVDDLSARGRKLIDRVANQPSTKELLDQGRSTISRGKALVTTARRGTADTRTAAKAAVTTARRELGESVDDAPQTVASDTKRAAKRTATTAAARSARTRSAAKATATSARTTAAAAKKAAAAAAEKAGD